MYNKSFIFALSLAAAPYSAVAATSLVDLGFPTTPNGGFGGYVVQSFTATIDNIAGIEILVGGSNVNQKADISIGLYSDAALTTQLASGLDNVDTSNPITGDLVNDLAEVTWSPTALTLGDTYYLRFDTSNSLVGFYTFGRPGLDFYLGGQITEAQDNAPFPNDYSDIASIKFFVDDDFGKDPGDPVTPVPLPAGMPFLLTGLGLLVFQRRKRSTS